MRNYHIKSLILGLGIGIILTSITGLVFYAGLPKEPDRERIIQEARKLGMVDSSELIGNEPEQAAKEEEIPEVKQEATVQPEAAEKEETIIEIAAGDTSQRVAEKLQKAGIISDARSFNKTLVEMKISGKLQKGTFTLLKGMEDEAIIRVLTSQP